MKFQIIALAALTAFTASNKSEAVYQPGQMRPQYEVNLKIAAATGSLTGARMSSLTHYTIDGSEKRLFVIQIDEEVQETYEVTEIQRDACGSLHYTTMVERDPSWPRSIVRRLQIADHSGRQCKDRRRGTIEVEYRAGVIAQGLTATLDGHGNPEPIFTTQTL